MLVSLLVLNLILAVIIKLYCKLTCGICRCSRHLVGRVVVVTGGNSGIGYETAKNMAERGARVILACRSETRGTAARDQIVQATGNTDVHFRRLDLASFASVRAFADMILKTEKRLDILINNAGIFQSKNEKTEDGLLLCMQVNHFGPFLLTSLLLPLLKSSAPSRIINVSSMAYQRGQIDFDNLNLEKGTEFQRHQMYSNSKLCNVLITTELERRLKGTGVTVNCLHPGFVKTNIVDVSKGWTKYLAVPAKLVVKNAWEGAQTSIYLAVSPDVAEVSGRYFRDCFEVSINKLAQDAEIARKLWEVSEKLTALK
ncbi:retinol dehydrogenase 14-like [Pectinophora gossypiella]|uniref:retinol dehydrogenase 14-like n=1 Tax=Pectinophora gossypiella TaxID=13191 RepID=UPI00214E83FE|nr:retinol dehydrogenase 14-like [Pectinophora gossypiella]